jgi:hypothetical protein
MQTRRSSCEVNAPEHPVATGLGIRQIRALTTEHLVLTGNNLSFTEANGIY